MTEFVQIQHDDVPPGFVLVRRQVDLRDYIENLGQVPVLGFQYRLVRVVGGPAHHDAFIPVEDFRESYMEPILKASIEQIASSSPVDPGSMSKDIDPFTPTKESTDA